MSETTGFQSFCCQGKDCRIVHENGKVYVQCTDCKKSVELVVRNQQG